MDLTKMREERARLFGENGKLLEEARKADRPLSAEETATYDAQDARIASLTATIDRTERQATLDAKLDEVREQAPAASGDEVRDARDAEYRRVFDSYLRRGMRALTPEQENLLLGAMGPEARAQGVATGAAGGFLVPQGFRGILIETLKSFGGIRSLADHLDTDTGNTMLWPTSNETAAEGAIVGENTAVAELDVTLGQASLGAFQYTSKMVKVSRILLQDSAFDLGTWLPRKLGDRIGRIQAKHLATGVGTTEPQGLMTGLPVGATTPAGVLTTYGTAAQAQDFLLDLIHSVDPAYRPRGKFVIGDGGLKQVRRVRDADGRAIWEPSLKAGEPDTLLGYPVVVDVGVATPAASTKSVAFGDIAAAYVIRTVAGVEVLRLDERFAELGQTAFLGWARMDAVVQDSAAAKTGNHPAV